ncbi:MAG TPA: hypothetical protein VK921_17940 [Anditalea sp.]|nr:hypothetical protein [Anditalea sp.]
MYALAQKIIFILGPVLLLTADLLAAFSGEDYHFRSGFILWLALLCFLSILFGLKRLTVEPYRKIAMAGVVSGSIGLMAAACITALYRVEAVLISGLDAKTFSVVEAVLLDSPIIATVFPFSPLFPVGLLLLSFAVWRSKTVGRWFALSIALGSLLFPEARMGGMLAVQMASGILLLIGLSGAAFQINNSDKKHLETDNINKDVTVPEDKSK